MAMSISSNHFSSASILIKSVKVRSFIFGGSDLAKCVRVRGERNRCFPLLPKWLVDGAVRQQFGAKQSRFVERHHAMRVVPFGIIISQGGIVPVVVADCLGAYTA